MTMTANLFMVIFFFAMGIVVGVGGYLIAAGMTVLFSLIVMGMTHHKLKGIDMIGALKENE